MPSGSGRTTTARRKPIAPIETTVATRATANENGCSNGRSTPKTNRLMSSVAVML